MSLNFNSLAASRASIEEIPENFADEDGDITDNVETLVKPGKGDPLAAVDMQDGFAASPYDPQLEASLSPAERNQLAAEAYREAQRVHAGLSAEDRRAVTVSDVSLRIHRRLLQQRLQAKEQSALSVALQEAQPAATRSPTRKAAVKRTTTRRRVVKKKKRKVAERPDTIIDSREPKRSRIMGSGEAPQLDLAELLGLAEFDADDPGDPKFWVNLEMIEQDDTEIIIYGCDWVVLHRQKGKPAWLVTVTDLRREDALEGLEDFSASKTQGVEMMRVTLVDVDDNESSYMCSRSQLPFRLGIFHCVVYILMGS